MARSGAARGWMVIATLVLAVQQAPVWAQEQQHAAAIAGYWTTDARFEARMQGSGKQDYFWVGKTWGRIDATGKLRFDAENGCSATGLLSPFVTMWNGVVSMSGCKNPDMDGRYEVSVGGGKNLSLRFSANRVRPTGGTNGFEVTGTFARYRP